MLCRIAHGRVNQRPSRRNRGSEGAKRRLSAGGSRGRGEMHTAVIRRFKRKTGWESLPNSFGLMLELLLGFP